MGKLEIVEYRSSDGSQAAFHIEERLFSAVAAATEVVDSVVGQESLRVIQSITHATFQDRAEAEDYIRVHEASERVVEGFEYWLEAAESSFGMSPGAIKEVIRNHLGV